MSDENQTDELYLILHKVRGKPTFDVATKVSIGGEEGWIIPTSGHRAYPISWEPVELGFALACGPDWDALPDHYNPARDDGSHLVNSAREILLRKGLISAAKPAQPAYRRS